jgi:hypothetical protein
MLAANLERWDLLGDLGIDRIILRWILLKQHIWMWIGFSWFRIWSDVWFLWTHLWTLWEDDFLISNYCLVRYFYLWGSLCRSLL